MGAYATRIKDAYFTARTQEKVCMRAPLEIWRTRGTPPCDLHGYLLTRLIWEAIWWSTRHFLEGTRLRSFHGKTENLREKNIDYGETISSLSMLMIYNSVQEIVVSLGWPTIRTMSFQTEGMQSIFSSLGRSLWLFVYATSTCTYHLHALMSWHIRKSELHMQMPIFSLLDTFRGDDCVGRHHGGGSSNNSTLCSIFLHRFRYFW